MNVGGGHPAGGGRGLMDQRGARRELGWAACDGLVLLTDGPSSLCPFSAIYGCLGCFYCLPRPVLWRGREALVMSSQGIGVPVRWRRGGVGVVPASLMPEGVPVAMDLLPQSLPMLGTLYLFKGMSVRASCMGPEV